MSRIAFEITRCGCGEITGTPCPWDTPSDEAMEIEWMPLHLRENHTKAGNHGVFPHNGVRRLILAPSCARDQVAADHEWTTIVS